MPASPARATAFEILLRIEREDSFASELLHSGRAAKLPVADHGLATELVMGVERWRSVLDATIQSASSQKLARLDLEVLIALWMGAYQLAFLTRVPARAAIFESVELVKSAKKRSAAPFVNAVLRKVAKGRVGNALAKVGESAGVEELAEWAAHPEWLIRRWVQSYGFEAARKICMHDQSVPVTAIRIQDVAVADELARERIGLEPGQLLTGARRVVSGEITRSRAFRERAFAIQDEASQLVALLVGQGNTILDCCAAPGSKTALIASRNPKATLVASDLHPHRARLLRGLIREPNVYIVAGDARDIPFKVQFDRVLADVPCSGTGTLSRHPEIKWRLKPEDIGDLQARQIAILRSALSRLAPGGQCVYSTCSLEREENEAVVEAVLAGMTEFSVVACREELERLKGAGELAWKDLDSLLSGPYLRTLPGVHPCDGFFAAVIRRGFKGR